MLFPFYTNLASIPQASDGEWGKLRLDFENGTAEIGDCKAGRLGHGEVQRLCKDGDTVCSEIAGGEITEICGHSV